MAAGCSVARHGLTPLGLDLETLDVAHGAVGGWKVAVRGERVSSRPAGAKAINSRSVGKERDRRRQLALDHHQQSSRSSIEPPPSPLPTAPATPPAGHVHTTGRARPKGQEQGRRRRPGKSAVVPLQRASLLVQRRDPPTDTRRFFRATPPVLGDGSSRSLLSSFCVRYVSRSLVSSFLFSRFTLATRLPARSSRVLTTMFPTPSFTLSFCPIPTPRPPPPDLGPRAAGDLIQGAQAARRRPRRAPGVPRPEAQGVRGSHPILPVERECPPRAILWTGRLVMLVPSYDWGWLGVWTTLTQPRHDGRSTSGDDTRPGRPPRASTTGGSSASTYLILEGNQD